jgi:hypothetical protein
MDENELERVVLPIIAAVEERGLASLAPRERVACLVWCFAGEVDNGGFAQFFFNSTGEHAGSTVEALREVGCLVSAALLEQAIALFPNGVPADLDDRNAALDDMPPTVDADWERLDRAYFEADSSRIYARLCQYWERAGG